MDFENETIRHDEGGDETALDGENNPTVPNENPNWNDRWEQDPLTVLHEDGVDEEVVSAQPTVMADSIDEEEQPGDEVELSLNPVMLAMGGGVGLLACVLVIALVALFVPPFRLAEQLFGGCQSLTADNPDAAHQDGVTAILLGEKRANVCLSAIPRELFLAGDAGQEYEEALAGIPPYLEMKSPLYEIDPDGEGQVLVEVAIPNDSEPYETLDLYRWDEEDKAWVFVPGTVDDGANVIRTDSMPVNVAVFQNKPSVPLIGTVYGTDQVFIPEKASALNVVFPGGISVGDDGTLTGTLAGGWQFEQGYAVLPVIRIGEETLQTILTDEGIRELHIQNLVGFAIGDSYNGIALDYRGLPEADRERFVALLAEIDKALEPHDKRLAVFISMPDVPPPGEEWNTGSYDWRAIGSLVDLILVNVGVDPEVFGLDGPIEQFLEWATDEVERQKLYPIASSQSVREEGDGLKRITYEDALGSLGEVRLNAEDGNDRFEPGDELRFDLDGSFRDLAADQDTGTYTFVRIADDGTPQKIWVVTASTVRARLDMVAVYQIGGFVIADLLADENDPGLVKALNEFKARSVSTVPSSLVMDWSVTGSSGAVLNEEVGLGTPFIWMPEEAGNYTVQGRLIGSEALDRGSVGVRVGAVPTTPEPTAAPTRAPGNSNDQPTPAPATSTPPPAGGTAGSDGGGFELGAQLPNAIVNSDKLQQAKVKWVKFQIKWSPGLSPSVAGGFVDGAHASGYKVLLAIPGQPYPQSIDFAGYTEFLRGVAAYKPDAIEVWNEMNITFEWPAGQIDPASYVNNMLAPGFNAIKSVSPGTMVIIGAPAPTGYNDPNTAMSDDRYVAGMASAGAARYANCIGVHHNAGTAAPAVRSGLPMGDHYSWYFLPTIEMYYNSFGGSLPVCLTEYGYVSDDGFSTPIPANFSWAANTTVQQQAQWISEGVQLARGLGWVRMMVIFNVGFTTWTPTDPQAGYNIVRPDGSCPACDALSGL